MLNFKRKSGEGVILTVPPGDRTRQIFIKVTKLSHVAIEAERDIKIDLCQHSLEEYREPRTRKAGDLKKLIQQEAKVV